VAADYGHFLDRSIGLDQRLHLGGAGELHASREFGIVRGVLRSSRRGPSAGEAVLCHRVGRLVPALASARIFELKCICERSSASEIDFETDASMVPDKIDHAALPQKALVLTHEKHGRLCQALYAAWDVFFRTRERNDLARFHLLCRAYRFDH